MGMIKKGKKGSAGMVGRKEGEGDGREGWGGKGMDDKEIEGKGREGKGRKGRKEGKGERVNY